MKNVVVVSCCLALLLAGCSARTTESAARGAATGAVSASFVGAVTDLIVDGKVDTYRLQRNMVAGAVAGGVAGGVVGARNEEAEQQQAAAQQASQAPPAQAADNADAEALKQKIGVDNVNALQALIECRREDAFRTALQTARSDNVDYSEAGLVIQALVDRDRGNSAGVDAVLPQVVAKNEKLADVAAAEQGLEKLYGMLQDERRVQGARPICP